MLTAIATILGAVTGLVPGILQFFTMRATNAQQLEIKKLELQAAREGTALEVDLAHAQSDIQQQQQLYNFAREPSGVRWVDALNTLIRPWITIVVFHMWAAVEIALLWYAINKGLDLKQIVDAVWDDAAKGILGAVVGFWFGNRMLTRGNQQMAATQAVTNPPITTKVTPTAPPSGFIPKPAGSRD